MSTLVLVCGNVFDGLSDALTGPDRNPYRGQPDYED